MAEGRGEVQNGREDGDADGGAPWTPCAFSTHSGRKKMGFLGEIERGKEVVIT